MFQLKWIWKNMEGKRWQYLLAQLLSAICAAMLLINPIISQNIIDLVIVGQTDPATRQTVHHTEFLVPLVNRTDSVCFASQCACIHDDYFQRAEFSAHRLQNTQQAVHQYAATGYAVLCA